MKRITLNDVAKAAGVSVSTVSRVLNHPDRVRESTRQRVLLAIDDLGYVSRRSRTVAREYLKYKNKMDRLPNDTVLSRWGMYSQDKRYRDETARIAKLIEKDMNINTKQAYYMLYYMVTNNIEDYERAKEDMYIDENFEIYRRKGGI